MGAVDREFSEAKGPHTEKHEKNLVEKIMSYRFKTGGQHADKWKLGRFTQFVRSVDKYLDGYVQGGSGL